MIVKHVFKRNLTCLTQLLNFFPLFFFIIYPQYFSSRRSSALVHPHLWALILLTMENMCLDKTFTRWEWSTRKDGSGISSSSFTLDDLRTWPREPLDGWFKTAHILLSLLLTTTSMINKWLYNASSTILRIEEASIIFELTSKFFGNSCSSSASSTLFYSASHLWQALE